MHSHRTGHSATKHGLSCLRSLLGINGLGKIAVQGHMAERVELAVIQFNGSDKSQNYSHIYFKGQSHQLTCLGN